MGLSRVVGAAAAASTAITLAGFGTTAAQSASAADCLSAFPESSLTAGQTVTGLTVSQGTTPDQFTGTVLGVLNDGIAPGMDMIMVKLSSPEIDQAGVWEGMSGSPVYAADGRLIGAVSYGLATGPSPVAGVTPAADMEQLLSSAAPTSATAAHVALSTTMVKRIVTSGAATTSETSGGMDRLRTPFVMSGMADRERLHRFARPLGLTGMHVMSGGAAGPAAAADPIVPGGNLAASISYGDVTTAGVGTVTAVCGDQVLGFGHPMNFTGDSTMTMHGADAIYVQQDPTLAGFKVANIGAPTGEITGDHLAGIVGTTAQTPPVTDVASTVTVGAASRQGDTKISMQQAVPDIASAQLVADQDRVFDGIGKGSGTVGWTIRGTRPDGTAFILHRKDVYADPGDISEATSYPFTDALYRIADDGSGDVTFTSITTKSTLSHDYGTYSVGQVQFRFHGVWMTATRKGLIPVLPGRPLHVRVLLNSQQFGPRTVAATLDVPMRVGRAGGVLQVYGGHSDSSGDPFEALFGSGGSGPYAFGGSGGGAMSASSLDKVLHSIRVAPHNDQVVVDLSLFNRRGQRTNHLQTRVSTGQVVNGHRAFPAAAL